MKLILSLTALTIAVLVAVKINPWWLISAYWLMVGYYWTGGKKK
jgi:hypothetical protein